MAVTAGSFLASGHDQHRSCFVNNAFADEPAIQAAASPGASGVSAPTYATVRGFPLRYYEEPFPANCVSYNASTGGVFNTAHLAYDFLIWLGAATLLFLPSALYKWWRGPAMLGDFKGRL